MVTKKEFEKIKEDYINDLADILVQQTRLLRLENVLKHNEDDFKEIIKSSKENLDFKDLNIEQASDIIKKSSVTNFEKIESLMGVSLNKQEREAFKCFSDKLMINSVCLDKGIKEDVAVFKDFSLGNEEHQHDMYLVAKQFSSLTSIDDKMITDIVHTHLLKLDFPIEKRNNHFTKNYDFGSARELITKTYTILKNELPMGVMDKVTEAFDKITSESINIVDINKTPKKSLDFVSKIYNESDNFIKSHILDNIKDTIQSLRVNEVEHHARSESWISQQISQIINPYRGTDMMKLNGKAINEFYKDLSPKNQAKTINFLINRFETLPKLEQLGEFFNSCNIDDKFTTDWMKLAKMNPSQRINYANGLDGLENKLIKSLTNIFKENNKFTNDLKNELEKDNEMKSMFKSKSMEQIKFSVIPNYQ